MDNYFDNILSHLPRTRCAIIKICLIRRHTLKMKEKRKRKKKQKPTSICSLLLFKKKKKHATENTKNNSFVLELVPGTDRDRVRKEELQLN